MLETPPAPEVTVHGRHRQRYAVISGSLGVGNVGDDALLAAFLAQHGQAYHGITVLTSERTRDMPGLWLLSAREKDGLPDSMAVLKLVPMGGRLGLVRSLPARVQQRLALQTLADGAPIDYVWLGGLLGQAPHIRLRSRELSWASGFVSRLVYYFGDAEVLPDAHEAARELVSRFHSLPNFVAVRSNPAAEELARFGFPRAQIGTDAVLFQYADTAFRGQRVSDSHLVISPCNYNVDSLTPLWLGMARAAMRRALPVQWVSLCDPEDLSLCNSLHDQLMREFGVSASKPLSSVVEASGALDSLRSAAATVATRFHAHIFSVCFGVPTMSISYGRKTQRLFDDLDLADWRLAPERASDTAQYETLLDRSLSGEFVTPETKLAELRRLHAQVVDTFSGTL